MIVHKILGKRLVVFAVLMRLHLVHDRAGLSN